MAMNSAIKTALSWAIPPVRLGLSGRNSGKTLERPLEIPWRVLLGSPKPYNSRHLKAPEHFQNCLPPVMEFPAVQGIFLISSE